jgi:hypothetical protein
MAALAFRGIIVGCARTMAVLRSGTASSFACYAFHPGRHSLKILIEEPVQGLSHCGGVRTVVGMELSASNERLDFALAEFDTEEPQPPASALAMPKHTSGRRRTRRLFSCRGHLCRP